MVWRNWRLLDLDFLLGYRVIEIESAKCGNQRNRDDFLNS